MAYYLLKRRCVQKYYFHLTNNRIQCLDTNLLIIFREIQKLCRDKIENIRVHNSVIERMDRKTANYAPGLLPTKFYVVDNTGNIQKTTSDSEEDEKRRKRSNRKVKK
ncbi:hypothetical protein [Candidatus Scalindua japonica]|uniref:hypothetical protein n=1 Tax=Candidatus Scalindua japonica TaxID=1284222 RepID=UPI000BDEBFD6|nr:hypothetical protein [Candidatus Scalindua japonica]